MAETSSTRVRRHSVAAANDVDVIHSPKVSFAVDNGSEDEGDEDPEDDALENSARARFSMDLHDPLDTTIYPHVHPHPSRRIHPLYRRMLVIFSLIFAWYTFSLMLSLYNKWMFAPAHLDFPFPLFVTSIHFILQFLFSGLVLWWFPQFRPKKEEYLTTKNYFLKIGPCGFSTGMDIGLSNASLKFITLAFYTLCKSSTLAFVLIFAFLFHLEKPSVKLIAVIATITLGVVLMVATETQFVFAGFVLVMTGSVFAGLRWSLTQLLLHHTPATRNPFSTLFHLAPVMVVSLLITHLILESPRALIAHPLFTIKSVPLLLAPGILAFCMTTTEFELIRRTGSVTLSVGGIFKEVLTVLAGTIVFGDQLAVSNIWGVLVTLLGIIWYNWIKIQKMKEDEMREKDAEGDVAGYEMVDREMAIDNDSEVFSLDDEIEEELHSRRQ